MIDSREVKREHFKSELWRRIYVKKEKVAVDEIAKELNVPRRWCLYQAVALKRKKFAVIERQELEDQPKRFGKFPVRYLVSLPSGFTWSC